MPGHREVRVELLVRGSRAPVGDRTAFGRGVVGSAFADEHLSVRWDDARCVPWRDSADVLWRGLPLASRPAAVAWTRRILGRHPGVLTVCAGYGGGWGSARLAVAAGAPPLTAYVSGGRSRRGTATGTGCPTGCGCGTECPTGYECGAECPTGYGCAYGYGCRAGCSGAATAAVASLLHACVTARLPLDRPLLASAASRGPDGTGLWAVHLVPESAGGSWPSAATRSATRPASEAPTPS